MHAQVIRNDEEYREVLKEIESLMGAKLGSAEGVRLDALVEQVQAWERKHHVLAGWSG